jgi:hypothetical protein
MYYLSFFRDSNSCLEDEESPSPDVVEDSSQDDEDVGNQLFEVTRRDDVAHPATVEDLSEREDPVSFQEGSSRDDPTEHSAISDQSLLTGEALVIDPPFFRPGLNAYFEGRNVTLIKTADMKPDYFYVVLNDETSSAAFSAMSGEMVDLFRSDEDLPAYRDEVTGLSVGSFVVFKVGHRVSIPNGRGFENCLGGSSVNGLHTLDESVDLDRVLLIELCLRLLQF